jgi:PleD family two-component response regulator
VSILDVLIVDDDKDTAGLFKAVLSQIGFQCEIVLNARAALDYLASHVPDMVLLDLRLGIEISGEDILFQIRSNPRFAATRVIVITAYPAIGDTVAGLADLVLIKPIEVDQLRQLAGRLGDFEIAPKPLPFHDPSTLLYNQDFFISRLELAFERARRRPDFTYGVLLFHLGFKDVDLLSLDPHLMFALLRQVVERLRQNLRPTDTIARFSSWKFAVLLEELKYPADIEIVSARVYQRLLEPYQVAKAVYRLEAAMAGKVSLPDYQQAKDILLAAEAALEDPPPPGAPSPGG